MTPKAINLAEKLGRFSERWSPKIVSRFNDNDIMVVKVQGEFVWHDHPETDDFFLVLDGELIIETEDGNVTLGPRELYVVPKGKSIALSRHGKHTSCLSSPGIRPTPGIWKQPPRKQRSNQAPCDSARHGLQALRDRPYRLCVDAAEYRYAGVPRGHEGETRTVHPPPR